MFAGSLAWCFPSPPPLLQLLTSCILLHSFGCSLGCSLGGSLLHTYPLPHPLRASLVVTPVRGLVICLLVLLHLSVRASGDVAITPSPLP